MTFVFRLLTSDFWIDLLISYSLLYFECTVTGTDGNCTGTDDTGMMVLTTLAFDICHGMILSNDIDTIPIHLLMDAVVISAI